LARACLSGISSNGLAGLGVAADGIPDFRRLNTLLEAATGLDHCRRGPGLVPDAVFLRATSPIAAFPSNLLHPPAPTSSIICQEPDIFHDVYGPRADADETRSSPTTCRPTARAAIKALRLDSLETPRAASIGTTV